MPDDPSAFDPADLFGDDAGAGRDFTRSVEDFFKSEDGQDLAARKRGLLEKYKAAKAAALARRGTPPAPVGPLSLPSLTPPPAARLLPALPPLPSLPSRPSPLPPLLPLPPSPSGFQAPAPSRGLPSFAPGKGNDA